MNNYKSFDIILQGRNRDKKKIDNNTYAIRAGVGHIAIRLHETDIIKHFQDGRVILNSGGWRTRTTLERINKYSDIRVYQKDSIWYVPGGMFIDGMTILPNGKIRGGGVDNSKKLKNFKKHLSQYAKDYVTALLDRKIEAPSNGDCFYCAMRTTEGKTLGEASKCMDHIEHHVQERYFVPSLIVRATELFPVSLLAKNIFALLWNPKYTNEPITHWHSDIARRDFLSSLKRYLYRQCSFAS